MDYSYVPSCAAAGIYVAMLEFTYPKQFWTPIRMIAQNVTCQVQQKVEMLFRLVNLLSVFFDVTRSYLCQLDCNLFHVYGTVRMQILLGHLCAHLLFSLSSRYRGKFQNTATNCITGSLNPILQVFLWEAPCYFSPIATFQLPGFCSHGCMPASSAACRDRN